MHDKALIVNKFWAGIIASVICAMFLGTVAYAWNANAQIAVMQNDINEIKKADLETKIQVVQTQLVALQGQTNLSVAIGQRNETQIGKMDDKLDKLLDRN